MSSDRTAGRIRHILEGDRGWSAYALADLDPGERAHCTWLVGDRSVVLIYRGLEPAVLFAHGDENECVSLLGTAPAGRYIFTLRPTLRLRLGHRLEVAHEIDMWRMVLASPAIPANAGEGCIRLGPSDQAALDALFDAHPDRPDAFHPRQLESGVFMAVREGSRLVAVAGTHIVAPAFRLAAVGNVFTQPAQRGRGLAGRTTAAVVAALLQGGMDTIVLNVAQANEPAIRCYHRLGFREHCAYREGVAELRAVPRAESLGVG